MMKASSIERPTLVAMEPLETRLNSMACNSINSLEADEGQSGAAMAIEFRQPLACLTASDY